MDEFPVYPPGCSSDTLIAYGLTAFVFSGPSDSEVIKAAKLPGGRADIESEKKIYERLNDDDHHNGLVEYRGSTLYDNDQAWALHLGRASKGQLSVYLATNPSSLDLRMRWARQIADVVRYVHSKNVVHGDLTCYNVFLDENLDVQLGDFASSSIDGSRSEYLASASHTAPNPSSQQAAELFALGSVFYQIMNGYPPFARPGHEEQAHIIEDNFQEGKFPDLRSSGELAQVIEACWNQNYTSMDAVVKDLHQIGRGKSKLKIPALPLLGLHSMPLLPAWPSAFNFAVLGLTVFGFFTLRSWNLRRVKI